MCEVFSSCKAVNYSTCIQDDYYIKKASIKHKPLSTDGKVDITHNTDTTQNVPRTKITVNSDMVPAN